MLLRTHLAIAVFFLILFIQHINDKWIFVLVMIVATIIPDLDSGFSSYGRHGIFRPLQFFVRHRGIVHSFTTATVLSILLAVYWPVLSFGFFLGYSVHLLADSFTREGIQPFWPLKAKTSGFILTGGRIEETVFFSLIFIDVILFFITFLT